MEQLLTAGMSHGRRTATMEALLALENELAQATAPPAFQGVTDTG